MTASQARRNWFRLLDEVAKGETVVIERNGRRIVIEREEEAEAQAEPDYDGLLRVRDLDEADSWSWSWSDADGLEPSADDAA